jgi:hypothetical protein
LSIADCPGGAPNRQSSIVNLQSPEEVVLDLPARVVIYCPTLEMKNKQGNLVSISTLGYYEVRLDFADQSHTAFLPIDGTVLVFAEPNPVTELLPGIER